LGDIFEMTWRWVYSIIHTLFSWCNLIITTCDDFFFYSIPARSCQCWMTWWTPWCRGTRTVS
jgi:hypothetical protein